MKDKTKIIEYFGLVNLYRNYLIVPTLIFLFFGVIYINFYVKDNYKVTYELFETSELRVLPRILNKLNEFHIFLENQKQHILVKPSNNVPFDFARDSLNPVDIKLLLSQTLISDKDVFALTAEELKEILRENYENESTYNQALNLYILNYKITNQTMKRSSNGNSYVGKNLVTFNSTSPYKAEKKIKSLLENASKITHNKISNALKDKVLVISDKLTSLSNQVNIEIQKEKNKLKEFANIRIHELEKLSKLASKLNLNDKGNLLGNSSVLYVPTQYEQYSKDLLQLPVNSERFEEEINSIKLEIKEDKLSSLDLAKLISLKKSIEEEKFLSKIINLVSNFDSTKDSFEPVLYKLSSIELVTKRWLLLFLLIFVGLIIGLVSITLKIEFFRK